MKIHEKLGEWYENAKRDLPWRSTSDPYKIWLSEIILQQTRVAQGTEYYHRFLKKFPDIFSLASAQTEDVLKIWQGLGYYSRARNLHETARLIVSERNGVFPLTYTDLIKLKGIGEYTASAISSIAYNEPRAAVDGNVKRVISRLFALEEEINSPEGKKNISTLAQEILDLQFPGRHNQAMMELGASICLPRNPDCINCPLNMVCQALKENKVSEVPVKYKKTKVLNRYFTYLIIRNGDLLRIQQRNAKDIWNGLYEFPLIETPDEPDSEILLLKIGSFLQNDNNTYQISHISESIIHKLSHRNIICRFVHILVSEEEFFSSMPGIAIILSELDSYPIPRLIDRYLQMNVL